MTRNRTPILESAKNSISSYRMILAVAFMLLLPAGAAIAAALSEVNIYTRCYVRLVRLVPLPTDPLYAQVAAGSLSGSDACLSLYDSAAMDSSGVMVNRTQMQARRVVKTFNDLHRTWIQQRVPVSTSGATFLLHDMEEPALYFTRAALQTGVPFSSIVTMNNGLAGVRDRQVNPATGNTFEAQRIFTYRSGTTYAGTNSLTIYYEGFDATKVPTDIGPITVTIPDNQLVDVGELVGTKTSTSLNIPSMVGVPANFEAFPHFGSGILGTQTFISDYNSLVAGQVPDGYNNIYRRLTAHVFEDLMCHQLPTLQPMDVSSEIVPTSAFTFQQSTSCLQCHSSVDNMALSYRNTVAWFSPFSKVTSAIAISGFRQVPVTTANDRFYKTPPVGRLHYREMLTNTMVDAPLNGIGSIGPLIAAGNDIYLCAAKRYYRFFTGIDVDLTQTATKPVDKYHQDLVVKFSQDFKQSNSVRTLINSIVHSDPFRSSNYNATGAP